MEIRSWQHGADFIVYDATQISDPSPDLFDPAWWTARGLKLNSFRGRGTVDVVKHGEAQWVLRHFRRGGLIRHLSDDSYIWTGLQHTRPWREWHLLATLHARGLPVPRPVAAHVNRSGLIYHGDIITELIVDTVPLAGLLQKQALPASGWALLGQAIKVFHKEGVHHPDINASNILLRAPDRFFLVDFDKAQLKADAAALAADLRRLRRSFDKQRTLNPGFHFDEACWQHFTQGYAG